MVVASRHITDLLWIKIAFLDCPTSRWLAPSLFTRLAGGTLALLSGGFQLAVAFRVDLLLTPRQHVLRRGGALAAQYRNM